MKQYLRIAFVLLFCSTGGTLWAQYGIGTNAPNASAALEIVSPDKGILIPRITLTNSNTLAPVTGTASTTHNGMLVYNDEVNSVNGLTGVGFYVWQGGATGNWNRITTSEDEISGTVTNTTLRWDGTQWSETTTLMVSDTGTVTIAANTTVTGTLEVSGTATLSSDLTVAGNSTASGTLTANSTTTLNAALVDSMGTAGTADQILTTTGTSTVWVDNFAPAAGTNTNTTLRWDGTAWVESETILQSDTGTATLAANTTVTGTLEVSGTATLSSDLTVAGNSTASGTLTANSTTTLNAALVDSMGTAGTADQILTTTGTSTVWVDNFAPAAGTNTNTTLRWDGTAWVESETILQSDTGTATLAANTTVTGTLEVSGTATLSSDLTVAGNSTASGTLTANSTTTLNAALVDSQGTAGTDGQVLSTTGTSTQWVDANAATVEFFTSNATPTITTGIVIINPASDTTITLADIATYPVGFSLKIRRNSGYTGTSDHIILTTASGATIDGQASKTMDVGYQSLTLVNIGIEWVSIQ